MQRKDGSVNLEGLVPEVREKLAVMEAARASALKVLLAGEMVVTSARDGVHGVNSKHYTGEAVDLRIRDFTDMWKQYLQKALGKDWDVVIEQDHLHLEWDPK